MFYQRMSKWQKAIVFTVAGFAVGTFAVTTAPQKPNPHLMLVAGLMVGPSLYSMGARYTFDRDQQ